MQIVIDHDKAKKVFDSLIAVYRAKEYPFEPERVLLPQDPRNMPIIKKMDDEEKARFFFYLCLYMRGRIDSMHATRCTASLFADRPDLFDPLIARNLDPEEIEKELKAHGLGFQKKLNAAYWISNSRYLVGRWGGSVINIFHDAAELDDDQFWLISCERICSQGKNGEKGGFAAFQKKMTSMLIYYLVWLGIISYHHFPLPADVHHRRKCLAHGILSFSQNGNGNDFEHDELIGDAVREVTFVYAKTCGVSSLDLCDTLWPFSRMMCSRNPLFKSTTIDGSGRKSIIVPMELKWTKRQVNTYVMTCGHCPVQETCRFVLRARSYYYTGRGELDERRDCPQQNILSAEEARRMLRWAERPIGVPVTPCDRCPIANECPYAFRPGACPYKRHAERESGSQLGLFAFEEIQEKTDTEEVTK